MSEREKKSIGAGGFVLGGLSFIPLIGVLFGIGAIVLGLASSRKGAKVVALLGALGIAFTIVLYGSLFYFGFVQRGGVYDGLRAQLTQRIVTDTVPMVEMYRIQHDRYPETLDELQAGRPANQPAFVTDGAGKPLYYERVGEDHYYLRGVGPDGQAFTADDVVPVVDPATADKLGLLTQKPAAPEPAAADKTETWTPAKAKKTA
jgi:hypothetical protein